MSNTNQPPPSPAQCATDCKWPDCFYWSRQQQTGASTACPHKLNDTRGVKEVDRG